MLRCLLVVALLATLAAAQNSTVVIKSNNLGVPSNFTGRHIACASNLDGTSTVVLLDIRGPNKKGEWRVSQQNRIVQGNCNAGFVNYLVNTGYQLNFQNSGINNADGSITKSYKADVTRLWATAFTTSQQQSLSASCALNGCCSVGNITRPVDITPCNACSPLSHYFSAYGLFQFNPDSSFYLTTSPSCVSGVVPTIDRTFLFKRVTNLNASSASTIAPCAFVVAALALLAMLL